MINTVSNTLPPVASSNTSSTVQQAASSSNAFAQAMTSAEQQINAVNTATLTSTQTTAAIEPSKQPSDEQIKASINLWRSLMKNPSTKEEVPLVSTATPESTTAPASAEATTNSTQAEASSNSDGITDFILQDALAKANSTVVTNEVVTAPEPTLAPQPTASNDANQVTAEAPKSATPTSAPQQSALGDTTSSTNSATPTNKTTSVSDIWRAALATSNSTTAVPTEAPTQMPLVEPEQPNPTTAAQAWQQEFNNPFTNTVQQTALDQLEKMLDYFKNQQQAS